MKDLRVHVIIKANYRTIRDRVARRLEGCGYTNVAVFYNDSDLEADYWVTAPASVFSTICEIVEQELAGGFLQGTLNHSEPLTEELP